MKQFVLGKPFYQYLKESYAVQQFFIGVNCGDIETVKDLFSENPWLIGSTDIVYEGESVLHVALSSTVDKYDQVLNFILCTLAINGANMYSCTNQKDHLGRTPLFRACLASATENALFLLNSSQMADCNIVDDTYSSCLLLATKILLSSFTPKTWKLFSALLERSSEFVVDLTNSDGRSVLYYAIEAYDTGVEGSERVLSSLINKKVDVNWLLQTHEGISLFLRLNNEELQQTLLQNSSEKTRQFIFENFRIQLEEVLTFQEVVTTPSSFSPSKKLSFRSSGEGFLRRKESGEK